MINLNIMNNMHINGLMNITNVINSGKDIHIMNIMIFLNSMNTMSIKISWT